MSAFQVSRDGVLTSIGNSPVPDGQTAPCWVEISHDGKYLFAINTASGTVSSYAIHADGSLTLSANAPFTNGAGAVDARLSPDGTTLSVTGGRGHVLSTFAVHGGIPDPSWGTPRLAPAADTAPTGLVLT